jgi:hypothetical protein
LDDLTKEGEQLQSKIRQAKKDNKDLKRNAEIYGRDLVSNNTMLDKLMIEEQRLTRVFTVHKKKEEHLKMIT